MIKVRCTREELEKITKIMLRAASMLNFKSRGSSRLEVLMDLSACHAIGCRLDLDALLNADRGDFIHDVTGIMAHLNRETGLLENCFTPRYALANHVQQG